MKLVLGLVMGAMVFTVGQAFSCETEREELARQNPFEIVDQLHHYSYDELREMYPDLDDRLMQALMYRIVESMKVPG